MLGGLVYDIWNEPDISIFWQRSQQQWLDLYVRTHKRIRQDPALARMLISGPTLAYRPTATNTWWTAWLSAIRGNDTIPDQYAYHLEGGTTDADNDLQYTNASLAALLSQHGLPPPRQVNINEYANSAEQVPAGAAWWIARLERYDAVGLRGNWMGGCMLHDLFANLLTRGGGDAQTCAATDYAPAPEYWVYRYYAHNMTGQRAATAGSGDRVFDVYATVEGGDRGGVVRVLAGARVATGTWYVTVGGLQPAAGTVAVRTLAFRGGSSVYAVAGAPQDLGVVRHQYSGGEVTLAVQQTDNSTAWAFELTRE
ncbi:glycoside hydrolase family 39 protein [Thermothielavioides terrestris NRRL 8126]|uniref:Glycoside hydrolase family 39 protein n=2 Tax=Thermothielavioides terrestris TaxID=2587410 RepID=G2QYV6_THETT|nr:glycoside hydrolase family 39 protein [Thermothielavioides terrestris NRRL 8126]AEO67095.1 glycoside hydrolase family 39 protein [Thermothielavioides terrestris NRRL 8126]